MPLPTAFAAQTVSTGAQLDANFAALGALTVIPCSVVGTNALTLTPLANAPAVPAYTNYMMFGGVAVATCSGACTAAIGGLPSLGVFKATTAGPVALVAGNIHVGNFIVLIYNTALAGGVGGFQILNVY